MDEIPIWRERQRLLHARDKKTAPEKLNAIAELCWKAGRLQEALDYFAGARNLPKLGECKDLALREGDAFLLNGVERALGNPIDRDDWNRCGDRALEAGKHRFAKFAFEKAANEGKLAELEAILEPNDPA